MSSSKKHCKNLFYNFPCDLPLSPWIFRKISGYQWQARRSILLWVNKNFLLDLHPVWHKILAAPVGVLHSTDTHLTTDVIYSHMHKDGSLFYAFQVHVSVTWNRGSRAGTGWDRAQEEQMEISSVSSTRNQAGFSQLLLTVRILDAGASPCHTQVPEPHHLQTSAPFFVMIS